MRDEAGHAERRRTAAVVAVKPLTHAKSRLGELPDPLRRRLAWCMTLDTLRALAAATDTVWVVGSVVALHARLAALGDTVRIWPETRVQGINAALADGAQVARQHGAQQVLACVGDLPALRADSVRAVLNAAPRAGRSFIADASGVGTTMLLADGVDLRPSFQGRSAAAHRSSGAMAMDLLLPDARRDVDTVIDLADAVRLGVGPATTALIDPATGRLGHYTVITALGGADVGEGRPGPLAVTAAGYRVRLPLGAAAEPLRAVRPGQRLHAVLGLGRPSSNRPNSDCPGGDHPHGEDADSGLARHDQPGQREVLSAWI